MQAKKRGTPVPETVIDQIRLWEAERNRVSYNRGFLYDSFANEQMYRETVQYAKDLSVYMYSNDEKRYVSFPCSFFFFSSFFSLVVLFSCIFRYLMADDSGHERIKVFLKKKYG